MTVGLQYVRDGGNNTKPTPEPRGVGPVNTGTLRRGVPHAQPQVLSAAQSSALQERVCAFLTPPPSRLLTVADHTGKPCLTQNKRRALASGVYIPWNIVGPPDLTSRHFTGGGCITDKPSMFPAPFPRQPVCAGPLRGETNMQP
uniref:Uncharacterized protein n=1 Tax=Myotis myotis TaxID=51298 RepID=A0A7J7XHX6_MYOMY|nr:hypothetical protein mMyoMyo1_011819 [Myotis myotis]